MPLGALLDACVLVPAALRDTLLRVAEAYLYEPLWSETILGETERTLVEAIGVSAADAADLTAALREAFPDAAVTGFDELLPTLTVDPHDRHVVAAAIAGHAQTIVTFNTRHFPPASLAAYHVSVQAPDTFLTYLFTLHPEALAEVVRQQAADLTSPPMSAAQVCDILETTVPGFAAMVRARLKE